jgi:hypothetical protein
MNWDYVRGKKKQKENKNKQTIKETNKNTKIKKNQKKCASGNIDHKPGMSHYIPCLIAE